MTVNELIELIEKMNVAKFLIALFSLIALAAFINGFIKGVCKAVGMGIGEYLARFYVLLKYRRQMKSGKHIHITPTELFNWYKADAEEHHTCETCGSETCGIPKGKDAQVTINDCLEWEPIK